MKNFILLVLSLSVMCSMAIHSFAVSGGLDLENNSAAADVDISYVGGTDKIIVRCVDIEWTDMTFTYVISNEKIWDEENNKYVSGASGWSNDGTATITVKNRSNIAVDIDVAYNASSVDIGVSASVKNGEFTLPSAEGKKADDTLLVSTATLTLSDSIPSVTETEEPVKIGTVTVTVADAAQ